MKKMKTMKAEQCSKKSLNKIESLKQELIKQVSRNGRYGKQEVSEQNTTVFRKVSQRVFA